MRVKVRVRLGDGVSLLDVHAAGEGEGKARGGMGLLDVHAVRFG